MSSCVFINDDIIIGKTSIFVLYGGIGAVIISITIAYKCGTVRISANMLSSV
jgi:hypothetical protein